MQEKKKSGLPIIDSTEMPESLDCTTCLLPMQYQKKIEDKFDITCIESSPSYRIKMKNHKMQSHKILVRVPLVQFPLV